MKKLLPILLAALALAALPTVAPAALLITQSGSNVVVSGSGSLITTGLSLLDTGNVTGGINPSQGLIRLSSTAAATAAVYSAAFSGSSNFGTGGGIAPTSGTGTLEGFVGTGALYVPAGYTSGTTLMGTSTYASATFTSLGITAGNYTFNYSATAGGAVLDTITVQAAVPEPSTWALLGIGAVGAGAVAKRRRSRSCA